MNPERYRPRLLVFTAVLLLVTTTSVQAAALLNGTLGEWINREASSQLAQILDQHPRLKGGNIRITGMVAGKPVTVSDQLTRSIVDQLTHNLLSKSSARIVLTDVRGCLQQDITNVLGVEIAPLSRNEYRVTLAVVDVNEGLWINGSNLLWRGRLTAPQQREYESRVAAAKTLFNIRDSERLAGNLMQQLECHPEIAAPVYLETAERVEIDRISSALRKRLATRTLTTVDRSEAASMLRLRGSELASGGGELVLEFSRGDVDEYHRLASAQVTGLNNAPPPVDRDERSAGAGPTLISRIEVDRLGVRETKCERDRAYCVDARFELFEPAYPVMFYTRDNQLHPVSCSNAVTRSSGRQHVGLNVPNADNRGPALGFYVVASRDRQTARRLQDALKKRACGDHNSTDQDSRRHTRTVGLLNSLAGVLQGSGIDWQAVHLVRDRHRVSTYGEET